MGTDYDTQRRIGVEGTPVIAQGSPRRRSRAPGPPLHRGRLRPLARCRRRGRVVAAGPRRRRRLCRDQARHRCRPRRGRRADHRSRPTAGDPRPWLSPRRGATRSARPTSATTRTERHAVPDKTFAWVHLDDLVSLVADVATSRVKTSDDPESGPVEGGCTAVNVAGSEKATSARLLRDGHQGSRRRPGLGRRPRVDGPHPGRPRPRLGLVPEGEPRPGARRDRRRAAHPRLVSRCYGGSHKGRVKTIAHAVAMRALPSDRTIHRRWTPTMEWEPSHDHDTSPSR